MPVFNGGDKTKPGAFWRNALAVALAVYLGFERHGSHLACRHGTREPIRDKRSVGVMLLPVFGQLLGYWRWQQSEYGKQQVHLILEILTNFDPKKLGDHFISVEYPQFSSDGAVLEAVLYPVDDFVNKRMPLIKHSNKMISAKTYILWQTNRAHKKAPDHIRADPRLLDQWDIALLQDVVYITTQRERTMIMLLEHFNHYAKEDVKKSGKRSIEEVDWWKELDPVDKQTLYLLRGVEIVIEAGSTTFSALYFHVWLSFFYESYNSYLWRSTNVPTTTNTRLQLIQHNEHSLTADPALQGARGFC